MIDHHRSTRPLTDDGSSLIAVIGISFVMLVLVSTILASALSGFRRANESEDFHAALPMAEAGVAEYIYRLNQDGNYWRFESSPGAPEDPDNEALDAGGVALPGGASNGTFRYTVDSTDIRAQGTVNLSVVGTVGEAERRVDVTLRRRSFLDYLYFTDLETRDPTSYNAPNGCDRYDWQGAGRPSGCSDIFFYGDGRNGGTRDVIAGPLHTNDIMRIAGNPRFEGVTTSSYRLPADDGGACVGGRFIADASARPEFLQSCTPSSGRAGPAYQEILTLPKSNESIKDEASLADAAKTGCLFTGPTKIRLESNERMTVWSPMSQQVNCDGAIIDGSGTMPLPENGVVFVQSVPSENADPNHTEACRDPRTGDRFEEAGWYPRHPFAAELGNDLQAVLDADDVTIGCNAGDVWIWGETDGQLTVAAANNISIVDDVGVRDFDDLDVLGLVAQNYILIAKPYGCTDFRNNRWRNSDRQDFRDGEIELEDVDRHCEQYGNVPHLMAQNRALDQDYDGNVSSALLFRNPDIDAALLSIAHTVTVQHYQYGGPMGTLSVEGAIGQRFRGPVGTFNTSTGNTVNGYSKAYVYDDRLRYLQPPHFIDPVEAAWQVNTWTEGVPGS